MFERLRLQTKMGGVARELEKMKDDVSKVWVVERFRMDVFLELSDVCRHVGRRVRNEETTNECQTAVGRVSKMRGRGVPAEEIFNEDLVLRRLYPL